MVAVVIVNFNAGELLTACVQSVLVSTVPVQVFVSDNGSTDNSLLLLKEMFSNHPDVFIQENSKNLGFARANNAVLSRIQDAYILFLNPDCVIQPDTIEKVVAEMESDKQVGMAGCLIRNLDGTEQTGCRRTVPTPWRTLMRILPLGKVFSNPKFQGFDLTQQPLLDKPVYLEGISGAFMLVRRQALEAVGPLDEGYFLHCEDLDWFMRFKQASWKILFIPTVEIMHVKGACSKSRPVRVLWHKHKGMVRFYRKFFRREYSTLLLGTVIVSIWMRFLALAMISMISRGKIG